MLNNVLWTLIRETRTQNFNYSYCDLPESGFQIIFTLSTKTSSAKSDKIVVWLQKFWPTKAFAGKSFCQQSLHHKKFFSYSCFPRNTMNTIKRTQCGLMKTIKWLPLVMHQTTSGKNTRKIKRSWKDLQNGFQQLWTLFDQTQFIPWFWNVFTPLAKFG